MEHNYLVTLEDTIDGIESVVLCTSEMDLANFLLHFNRDRYAMIGVECYPIIHRDKKDFMKPQGSLEIGEGNIF